MVRAFDGTKPTTSGEIDLKVLVGLCEFEVPFVVVDIPVVYNLLPGRPWIHTLGAIPSSLHQKAKFYSSIMAEVDLKVPSLALVPFIDAQQVGYASKYYYFDLSQSII